MFDTICTIDSGYLALVGLITVKWTKVYEVLDLSTLHTLDVPSTHEVPEVKRDTIDICCFHRAKTVDIQQMSTVDSGCFTSVYQSSVKWAEVHHKVDQSTVTYR